MFSWILKNHEKKFTRLIEILPGLLAWGIIFLPAVGGLFFPTLVAYILIAFVCFWFMKSFKSALLSIRGYFIMKEWEKINWEEKFFEEDAKTDFEWNDVKHVIIIPTYNESVEVLTKALNSLKNQVNISKKNLIVVLGMEERAVKAGAKERAKTLLSMYKKEFGMMFDTYHPAGLPGEIPGKASNEAWAAKEAKKVMEKNGMNIKDATITSCDSDTIFDKNYFAALNYHFIKNPNRYVRFWQSTIFWYNNLHKVPFPIKMLGIIGHAIHLSDLQDPNKLIFNQSSYSLSFKLLDDVGYWHTDIIPEDWHLFLQTFFAKRGEVLVEPLFLATHIDAPESSTWFGSLKNRYEQCKRHAWGASDIPYAVKESIKHKEIPLLSRVMRVYKLIETHIIWSTNWFLLSLGATLPVIINPAFARTTLGHNLPKVAEGVLTVCLLALGIMIIIDLLLRPEHAKPKNIFEVVKEVVQWITLPLITLPLSVLPGLHAQTILMSGKRLEYKTTEKV